MLNLRTTNIVFALLLALLVWMQVAWYWYLVLVFVYTLPLFYGSYAIGSNFYVRVTCQGPRDVRAVALSFDDGPVDRYTPQILDELDRFGVKAAFFCIGQRVEGREDLVRDVYERGHVIGNHSFSHDLWFDLFGARRMSEDLRRMDTALEKVIGRKPLFFRPPYGVTNPNVRKAIQRGGYTPVGWNIRSLDTVTRDPQKLLARVTAQLRPGAIILFHDTSASTLAILGEVISRVRAQGYDIVRLDKMINLPPYA
jgi:peptidoglycan-N-acetylglucosamine deacetylase